MTTPFVVVSGLVEVQGQSKSASAHVLAVEPGSEDAVEFDHVPFFVHTSSKDGVYTIETPAFRTLRLVAWTPHHVAAIEQVPVQKGAEHGPRLILFTTFATARDVRLDLNPDLLRAPTEPQRMRARLRQAAPLSEAWLFDVPKSGLIDTSLLPTGEYRVENIGFENEPVLAAGFRDQPLPAPGLDPSRRSGLPPRLHRLQVDGVPAPDACEFTAGPAGSLFTSTRTQLSRTWNLPSGNPAVFTMWCPGFAPTSVVERDFFPNGPDLVASVRPTRGWGVLLAFRADEARLLERAEPQGNASTKARAKKLTDALAMPPLPGVRVQLKALLLGTSDADGCVLTSYTVQPDQLSLVAPGWHMSSIERMPGSGSRWWVWMKRDP
jgi:hypothetical protein